jgi:tRNA pseudouridine55 synthase
MIAAMPADVHRQADGAAADALCGVLVIDKPPGPTSMRAVSIIRRKAMGLARGERRAPGQTRPRVGHAGTLDPLAEGVLVVAIGRATKLVPRLMNTAKRYRTTIDLSAFTSTDDAEGEREEIDVPLEARPDRAQIERVLRESFTGEILQRPPAFSAMKVGGRRAYKLARAGEAVEIAARPVRIHSIDVIAYDWPLLTLAIHCGKGTYIRSIARDLGGALATGGYCAFLRRTAVGPFDESMAIALNDVPERLTARDLIPIERVMEMLEE